MSPRVTKLANVIIPVADQDRVLPFYTDALGLEKRVDAPFGDGNRWIELDYAGFAAGVLQDPPDARDQPLQGGAIEAVGAAEAVHHLGLDVALPGMADVLGQRVVAHHRTVLVPPLGGPQVHAHACSVSAA